MILADKIIKLRKKNGWSQEELADKINVSRQTVSKWESSTAVPSLNKILQLGKLFGVTSDYLLKDEIDEEEIIDDSCDPQVKRVSLEEANNYIEHRKKSSRKIAIATFLCILSPITLLILSVAAELPDSRISDTLAAVIGLSALFAFVLCAVPIYILCGFKNAPYAFLETNEPFELEYGARDFVKEKIAKFRKSYVVSNIIAVILCIFSPVPLILSAFTENVLFITIMLSVTIIIAGTGVVIFILAGVQNASMQKLLEEGEYTSKEKLRRSIREPVGFVYWGIVVAIYLIWSFMTNDWHITWLTFAVGGILFPVLMTVCNILMDRYNKD